MVPNKKRFIDRTRYHEVCASHTQGRLLPPTAMRSAAAWLGACFTLSAALSASVVSAQGLVAEEPVVEGLGTPPPGALPPPADTPNVNATPAEDQRAQPDADLLHNVKLLDTLLIQAAQETIREQKFAAASGITGGAILIGLGSWRLIENTPQSEFSRGLGVMFMTLGFADLTTGIFVATRVSHEKRRITRWENLKTGGVGELDLARMEGELLAASEMRQAERLLVRWNGLTHAIAGALVFAFSPLPNNDQRDRRSAWVVGGLFVATGMTAFALSYRDTPSEEAWKEYQAKKAGASANKLNFEVAPAMWKGGGGIAARGTF